MLLSLKKFSAKKNQNRSSNLGQVTNNFNWSLIWFRHQRRMVVNDLPSSRIFWALSQKIRVSSNGNSLFQSESVGTRPHGVVVTSWLTNIVVPDNVVGTGNFSQEQIKVVTNPVFAFSKEVGQSWPEGGTAVFGVVRKNPSFVLSGDSGTPGFQVTKRVGTGVGSRESSTVHFFVHLPHQVEFLFFVRKFIVEDIFSQFLDFIFQATDLLAGFDVSDSLLDGIDFVFEGLVVDGHRGSRGNESRGS